MLNEEKILILNKNNKDITSKVIDCSSSVVIVKFENKTYPYQIGNLKIINTPTLLENCIIKTKTRTLSNVLKVVQFNDYIKVFFHHGKNKLYNKSELIIEKDILKSNGVANVFSYFKEMASIIKMTDILPEEPIEKEDNAF